MIRHRLLPESLPGTKGDSRRCSLTARSVPEGELPQSKVQLHRDPKQTPDTQDEFRKLEQSPSSWESQKFSSVVTKNVKIGLLGFLGLELLNTIPLRNRCPQRPPVPAEDR